QAAPDSTITSIALPEAGKAWLTTDVGLVFGGELGADGWHWRLENRDSRGVVLNRDQTGDTLGLQSIAIGPDHHGYAVGDRGLILERTGDGDRPWVRLKTPFLDNLTAVALGASGHGALVGGRNGVV